MKKEKHVIEEGSRHHVISYDSKGRHCSEPNCEINNPALLPVAPSQEEGEKGKEALRAATPTTSQQITLQGQAPLDAANIESYDKAYEQQDIDPSCEHKYRETLRGVECLHCGHFVGNWE